MKTEWYLSKIPKTLHVYWGEERLPFLRYLTIYTFQLNNPTWKIKYYYPKQRQENKTWSTFEQKYSITGPCFLPDLEGINIEKIEIDMEKLGLSNNLSEVYKSDYLRWYILSEEGGLWSDMDILFFKSMNEISVNQSENSEVDTLPCIADIPLGKGIYGHSIGFEMSAPNNSFYQTIYNEAKKIQNVEGNYQSLGSVMLNRLYPTIESIKKAFPKSSPMNIEHDTVYAYNAMHIKEIFDTVKFSGPDRLTKNTIGFHWYAGHSLAEQSVNTLIDMSSLKASTSLIGFIALNSLRDTRELMSKYIQPEDSILDCGCGTKEFSNYLKNKGHKVTTIDAWKKFNPDILHDLNKTPLPLEDNSVDIVIIIDVIEHLDKKSGQRLLKELKRIVRKNIILLTPLWWTLNNENVDDIKSEHYQNFNDLHKSLWTKRDFLDWHQISNVGFLDKYYLGVWNKIENTKKQLKPGLTIHTIVRNEPFIYYAIKSVYPYATKILLYDTGSDDAHTLNDIKRLIQEDGDNKIIFKKVPIDVDETKWTIGTIAEMIKSNIGKFTKGRVRQMQIDDTETEFFMLVDGDEVHYPKSMETILKTLKTLPENIKACSVPLTWFYDMNRTFECYPFTCRVFRTNDIMVNNVSPNEAHIVKGTHANMGDGFDNTLTLKDITGYAHFENLLKPWRREGTIKLETLKPVKLYLPSVMLDDMSIVNRFLTKEK